MTLTQKPNSADTGDDLKREVNRKEENLSKQQPTGDADSAALHLDKGKDEEREVSEQHSLPENRQGNDIIEFIRSFAKIDPRLESQCRVKHLRPPPPFKIRRRSLNEYDRARSRTAIISSKKYNNSENTDACLRRIAAEETDGYRFYSEADGNNRQSSQDETRFILDNIGSFIDEAVTKPVLRNMVKHADRIYC